MGPEGGVSERVQGMTLLLAEATWRAVQLLVGAVCWRSGHWPQHH